MTCTMGVGCDETGVCYALAQGQPERCARIPDRCTCDKPTWDEPEVGMCDRCEELARIERDAQAIEARRAETSGSVHESAVRQDAPEPSTQTRTTKKKGE